jgi:acyl transferase domain-containing protein
MTKGALEEKRQYLSAYLREHPQLSASDAAYTLQVGRAELTERTAIVWGGEPEELAGQWIAGSAEAAAPLVLKPDGDARVSWELYASAPTYRAEVDRVVTVVRDETGRDLRNSLAFIDAHPRLSQFAANWSLGRTMMMLAGTPRSIVATGPAALAAAALSGVITLKEAVSVALADGVAPRLRRVRLAAPEVALTASGGGLITRDQALDPDYWVTALSLPTELGTQISSSSELFAWLGRLWVAGASIDWPLLYPKGSVGRVRLPGRPPESGAPSVIVQPSSGNRAEALEDLARREKELFAAQEVKHEVKRVDDRPGLRQRMEAYCASRVYDLLLREGGASPEVTVRSRDLIQRIGASGDWTGFVEMLLGILAKAGDATILDTRIRFRNSAPDRTGRIFREILRDCPEAKVLTDLVDAAVSQLPAAMRGLARMPESVSAAWDAAAEWRAESPVLALAAEATRKLGTQAVRVVRTRAETWERLALGLEPVMPFAQWEAELRKSGDSMAEPFPRALPNRAATSLGLFLLFKGETNSC